MKKTLVRENGYTLVETLVAMSLFLGVLLPLIGSLGILMLDRTSDELREALRVGGTEMTEAIARMDFAGSVRVHASGYRIERTVVVRERLAEIRVDIIPPRNPQKRILTLSHSVLITP